MTPREMHEGEHDTNARPSVDRISLAVGVTGHRPGGLSGADIPLLYDRVRELLTSVRDASALQARLDGDSTPAAERLLVVSPLAEGADRIVAEEGLALGFRLLCPLPFEADGYEQDFASEESRAEFRRLLAQAATVIEIGGRRNAVSDQGAAYAEAGRAVLDRSDLLVAVWDGEQARGAGGTAHIVAEAVDHGLLVAWIESHPPHLTRIISRDAAGIRSETGVERLPPHLVQRLHER